MELRHDMLSHGVNIVCAAHQGKLGGLAVAWATQVAKEEILICVGPQSATRELILGSQAFGLSVLAADQVEAGIAFGRRSIRDVDKFEGVAYHLGETASPLLDDCALTLDCRIVSEYDHDTMKLIVGRVAAVEWCREKPRKLVYVEEDYRT